MDLRHWLHPHTLPDARCTHVDRTARPECPRLFAARLGITVVVAGAHNDLDAIARRGHPAHIAGKGAEPASMTANFLPVYPNSSVVVDRLKVE